jgi:hypothetical protein
VFVGLRSSVTALAARDRFSRAGRRGSRRLVCGTLAIVARHLPPGTESRRAGWRRGPEIVRALVGTDGRPGRGLGRGPTVGQRLKGAGMVLDLHGPLARRRGPAATPVHVMNLTSPHQSRGGSRNAPWTSSSVPSSRAGRFRDRAIRHRRVPLRLAGRPGQRTAGPTGATVHER